MIIDRNARLRENRKWGDYHLLGIDSPALGRAARPGQFVMVKAGPVAVPLLRRPLSVHDAGPDGIELFFQVAGQGTAILAGKRPGDLLDIVGPLGNGFTVSGALKGKRVFCVGGGRGIAPLFFLARELAEEGARVTVFYGGRTAGDLPLRGKFERAGLELLCSTDDGSHAFSGLVTELVGRELGRGKPDLLCACGPDPMMSALASMVREARVPSEFSLEAMMGCGIGACWGCVHRVRDGGGEAWTKICEDGPVFPGDRIVWTEGRR
jgi:dihydroorotate dehydrogenase electron transfer subunit